MVNKTVVMQVISGLDKRSCLTNILSEIMGPTTYDIFTPAQDKTSVYVNSSVFERKNQKSLSLFLESFLINLLDFINDEISKGKLKYEPFMAPNRRNSSAYDIELTLSNSTQKKYENLSQGWILIP